MTIKSRIKVDEDAVKAYNEEQIWYAFKRDGTVVTGKLKDLKSGREAGK